MSVKAFVDFTDFDGSLESRSFDPVPSGYYEVLVDTSSVEEIKKGEKSEYVRLAFTITQDGDFKGQKLFDNFMIGGKGVWKLGALLVATGLMGKDDRGRIKLDFDQLHNKACKLRVALTSYTDAEGKEKPKNEIKAILPSDDAPPASSELKKGKGKSGFPV